MQPITTRIVIALLAVLAALLLAACSARPPLQSHDPQVQAARRACRGLPQSQRYICIEQQAIAALNPDVCRLLGIAMDDACLQFVYEAADDPAICDRLYLPSVALNCRAYYASLGRVAPAQPAVTSTASQVAAEGTLIPYTSDDLGLALAFPSGWKVEESPQGIAFRGPPHGSGPTPLEARLSILVKPAAAGTSLDDVVAAQLAQYPDLAPQIRRTDITLGGETAAVLEVMPGQFSNRQAFVLHGGRLYQILVMPYDTVPWDNAVFDEMQAEGEAIWQAVVKSWQFLEQAGDGVSLPTTEMDLELAALTGGYVRALVQQDDHAYFIASDPGGLMVLRSGGD